VHLTLFALFSLLLCASDIGAAMSGFVADARTLVDHARVETQNHWFTYDERMGVEACVQSVCDLALVFGEKGMARPFGVALLVGGVDENGPALFHVDPSGTQTRFLAKAIGAGSEGAQSALKDHYHKSLTLKEAQKLALQILKDVMEDKISGVNVEMALIPNDTKKYHLCTKDQLEQVIKTLDADLI
jgi:20S proteasome subunit alpha 5